MMFDSNRDEKVQPELAADIQALRSGVQALQGAAANHAWADAAGGAVPNGSYGALATVSNFSCKVSGKLRIIVTGVFENANNSIQTAIMAVGYAPHSSPAVEQYATDAVTLAANGGAGHSSTASSLVWYVTGLALNTPLDIAAMGNANAASISVAAHGVQIEVQEVP